MKRLLLAMFLIPSVALADLSIVNVTKTLVWNQSTTTGQISNYTQTANSSSANTPTTSTPGISLTSVCKVRVTISADSGQTLSGGGTALFYYSDPSMSSRWAVNKSVSLSVTSTTRDQIADYEVGPGAGKLYVEASSVTVSSGSVTVRINTSVCK